jgi:hypothetical protein
LEFKILSIFKGKRKIDKFIEKEMLSSAVKLRSLYRSSGTELCLTSVDEIRDYHTHEVYAWAPVIQNQYPDSPEPFNGRVIMNPSIALGCLPRHEVGETFRQVSLLFTIPGSHSGGCEAFYLRGYVDM